MSSKKNVGLTSRLVTTGPSAVLLSTLFAASLGVLLAGACVPVAAQDNSPPGPGESQRPAAGPKIITGGSGHSYIWEGVATVVLFGLGVAAVCRPSSRA